MDILKKDTKSVQPSFSTFFLNRLLFYDGGAVVSKGMQRSLVHEDLWKLPKEYRPVESWNSFWTYWKEEIKGPNPSVIRACRKAFLRKWILAVFYQSVFGILLFVTPVLLPYMIDFLLYQSDPYWYGFVYVSIIYVCTVTGSFFYYHALFMAACIGVQLRTVMIQLIYRKVLKLPPTAGFNSGKIMNLIANDAQFFADTMTNFIGGLVAPIQVIVAFGLLWQHIGPYALLTLAIMAIMLPFAAILTKQVQKIRQDVQQALDKRLKLLNELVLGIRIIKFYAWESSFKMNIRASRETELRFVKKMGLNRAYMLSVIGNTTTVVIGVTFLFYGLFGSQGLNPAAAFATLALINLLRLPFFLLPFTANLLNQYRVTFERIQSIISMPELTVKESKPKKNLVIRIKNANFSWDGKSKALKNINLKIKKGELLIVVGKVGSGKSTLAMSLLGELVTISGKRAATDSIAYVPQEAWIINASVKENILMGLPFDKEKYDTVIQISALGPDLAQLPNGDQTPIGDRGINLSGGQKQRVSIARALYSDRELYIFDDPLSALDAHVGKFVYEEAISKYLKNRSVVLVTNQLQHLTNAHRIAVMSECSLAGIGSYEKLMKDCEPFREVMSVYSKMEGRKEGKNLSEAPNQSPEVVAEGSKILDAVVPEASPRKTNEESGSKSNGESKKAFNNENFSVISKQNKEMTNQMTISSLKKIESKSSGPVSWRVFLYFILCGGRFSFLSVILCYVISNTFSVTSAWWLSEWSTYQFTDEPFGPRSNNFFVGVYIAFLIGQTIFSICAQIIFVLFCTRASRELHHRLLEKVVKAPTSFFDVTPIGQITNRFAKELNLVDIMLPMQFSQWLNSIFQILGVFAGMCFASPYVLLAIGPVIGFYIWFQNRYRHSAIELQRLEAVSRAPLLSHLSTTMSGVSSVRSYRLQEKFTVINENLIGYNTVNLFSLKFLNSWFGLRLDFTGELLVLVTLLAIVLLRDYDYSSINIGFAALAMAYTSGITFVMSNLNRMGIETETRMNSVERVKEYDSLPQEAPDIIPENRPPKNWPSEGKIVFHDYSLAYRKDEVVLKNISLVINGNDKIGIVGRTGAGKSSLMQALFRFVEPLHGYIEIDGINISNIGLNDLRMKLSIIPQDPTLFIGTLRYNLDPLEQYTDKELWDILELVQLKKFVSELPGKLEEPIAENGSNLSMGQRQLLCTGRALLRNSKILLMDEATASMDMTTDALIQEMVHTHFKSVTVLTIAHRLITIMDSTKVMVLEKGEIVGYDAPALLLKQPDNIFTSMVKATGPSMSRHLEKIAIDSFEQQQQQQQKKKEEEETTPVKSNGNGNRTDSEGQEDGTDDSADSGENSS